MTYAEIARDLTQAEIDARHKLWSAAVGHHTAVYLTAEEAAALWSSILQGCRELSWYREQLPVGTATIQG